MRLSITDIIILALIALLIYAGRWFDELGNRMGQALRRFKGSGPGGPTAA